MTSTAREILAEHRTTIAEFEKRQAEAKLAEVQAELQKKRDDWVMVVGLATKLEARLAAVVDALGNPRADPRYESTGRMLRAIRISEEGLAAAREQPTQAFECKARTGKADPPQDCDWPFCGCDPAAERVLTAIQESGLKLVREPTQEKLPLGHHFKQGALSAGFTFCYAPKQGDYCGQPESAHQPTQDKGEKADD
jgi:hypothetical protein